MLIATLSADLSLQGVASLKQKRSIVKGVIGRIKSRFNCSISEVDHQDSKRLATLGLAVVSNDRRFLDQQLDSILAFLRADGRFFVSRVEREVFS
jgi:uncharacterized protein YlxP (DUF503 family)